MQRQPSKRELNEDLERLQTLNVTDEKRAELTLGRFRQFSDDRQAYFDEHFPKAKRLAGSGTACSIVAGVATFFTANSIVSDLQARHFTILPTLYFLLSLTAVVAALTFSVRGIAAMLRLMRAFDE